MTQQSDTPMCPNEKMLRDHLAMTRDTKARTDRAIAALCSDPDFSRDHFWKTPKALDSFLWYYVDRVVLAKDVAELLNRRLQEEEYYDGCLLRPIMQKKLFDLQCRWMAGEVELPGIGPDEFSLPDTPAPIATVLGKISEAEFKCYQRFRTSVPLRPALYPDRLVQHSGVALRLYHAHRLLHLPDAETLLPEWFAFYDAEFGTGPLRHLPILRADAAWAATVRPLMEDEDPALGPFDWDVKQVAFNGYDLYWDTSLLSSVENIWLSARPVARPFSIADQAFVARFLKETCSEEEVEFYAGYLRASTLAHRLHCLLDYANRFKAQEGPVPLAAHPDILEALHQADRSLRHERDSSIIVELYLDHLKADRS